MRVFVSVDMEGASGVTDIEELHHGGDSYEHARRWMTLDAAAAVEGALAAGATEVVVCDAHGESRNLLVDSLPPRTVLVRGRYKPARMMEGLDGSFEAALFVGYHARAGAHPGVLNHTWVGRQLLDLRIDGEPAGELRLNALVAGALGVQVVLVTGDDVACAEAEALLPGVHTVAVKRAIDRFAAFVEHPEQTSDWIRTAAEKAVRERGSAAPLAAHGPVTLEVDWSSTHLALACSLVPGVELVDGRTSRYRATDIAQARDVFIVLTNLAAAAGDVPPF